MRIRRAVLVILLVVVVGSLADLHALAAQACFAPHPLPRCRSYWLTEFGLGGGIGVAGILGFLALGALVAATW